MNLNEAILYFSKKGENSLNSRDSKVALWLKELQEYRNIAKDNKLLHDYMYSKVEE